MASALIKPVLGLIFQFGRRTKDERRTVMMPLSFVLDRSSFVEVLYTRPEIAYHAGLSSAGSRGTINNGTAPAAGPASRIPQHDLPAPLRRFRPAARYLHPAQQPQRQPQPGADRWRAGLPGWVALARHTGV